MATETVPVPTADQLSFVPPYSPGWIDRVIAWIDRLPLPVWATCLLMGLLLVAIELVIQWQGGTVPGRVELFPVYLALTTPYLLALHHHLNQTAVQGLDDLQSVLVDQQAVPALRYRLTTLSAGATLVSSVLGVGLAGLMLASAPIQDQLQLARLSTAPASVIFNGSLYILNWAITGVVLYHAIHQLRLVHHIYTRLARPNLYLLGPLYTFSRLSAQTAIGLGLLMYLPAFILPEFDIYPGWTLLRVAIGALIAVIFVSPLLGIHGLLVREKARLLDANAAQFQTAFRDLHHCLDTQDLASLEALTQAIDGLESEQRTLQRFSTWPWQPETPRAVLVAVLVPLLVWLMEWVLRRFLEV